MRVLAFSSRGPAVQLLQLALNRSGFASLETDGVFGPATQAALTRFQAAQGLKADGVAGPLTHRALNPWYTGYVPYTLRRGDSFYRLARRYGSTVQAISAANPDLVVIDLLDALGDAVKEEEVVEGMEAEHDHDHEDHEEDHEEEGPEYDEHVWLSLKNAQTLCRAIAGGLAEADGDNADRYEQNAEAYCDKLKALDEDYAKAVQDGTAKTLLFADRFPFRYLADDYGLNYYAAFTGCSAESEASFETIVFLAGKVDELGLGTILQIESADGSIARTVVENTKTKDQQILTLDSLQSVTASEVEAGTTYLSVMESNLEVLRQALA